MCRFKSGLIFKDRVVLAPMYNESHSRMLKRMEIEDSDFNARKVFIRAELLPENDDIMSDINKWKYVVDQDVTPDWYDVDSKKYEDMFRAEVRDWRDNNIFEICGQPCTKLKEDNGNTYYHTCKPLFSTEFGDDNNYATSTLRKQLVESDFAKALVETYGDALVPVTMDLTSLGGLKDYGKVTDIIGIPDLNLYRECREHTFVGDDWWWLSTPYSISSWDGSFSVPYVSDVGDVGWRGCGWDGDVRPFFILKS